jgi:hypothetical protein
LHLHLRNELSERTFVSNFELYTGLLTSLFFPTFSPVTISRFCDKDDNMDTLLKNLSSLSVNKSSQHPNVTDSSHIPTTDFAEPSDSLFGVRNEDPLVTDVVVRHSSAFNSERESGMNKVQQLQFIELVKKMIIGTLNNS